MRTSLSWSLTFQLTFFKKNTQVLSRLTLVPELRQENSRQAEIPSTKSIEVSTNKRNVKWDNFSPLLLRWIGFQKLLSIAREINWDNLSIHKTNKRGHMGSSYWIPLNSLNAWRASLFHNTLWNTDTGHDTYMDTWTPVISKI